MRSFLFRSGLGLAVLALAACQRKVETAADSAALEHVATVGTAERSRHFAAVNRHLELGGTLYGYADVEGDVGKVAGELQRFLGGLAKSQPPLALVSQQDLASIAKILGLTDIKALGVSSVPEGNGFFRNRLFVYTGGDRHGLMAAMGGKPGPFKHLGLAPADTAFYGESEMDLGVVYRTIKDVVTQVVGEPASSQLETALKKAGEAAAISYLDLIYGLKGRPAIILRVEPEKTIAVPGPPALVLPGFALLACIEGIGQIVEPSLAKDKKLRRSNAGFLHVYEPVQPVAVEGVQLSVVVDGSTLYVTTSMAFLQECRAQKSGLGQTAEFKQALAQLGTEGNGLSYASPRLFSRLRDIEKLNPDISTTSKSVLNFFLAQMPAPDRPLVAVRTNTGDGLLVRSYLNRSMKQDLAAVGIYNPVTLGLMAAMVVPAWQQARLASADQEVMNNLRLLASAAEQHYRETGTTTATYDQLVGPERAIKGLNPVAGENYRTLRFQQGQPIRLRLQNGKVLQYPVP